MEVIVVHVDFRAHSILFSVILNPVTVSLIEP